MKVLKVKEITVPIGQEYMPLSYPSNGAYIVNGDKLAIVAANCVYVVIGGLGMVEPLEPPAPPVSQPAGVSEDTLLKAIALAQNPALISVVVGGSK